MHKKRFTRIKHDKSFPIESVKYILSENNIRLEDNNAIVFYEKPFLIERLLAYIGFAPKFVSFAASACIQEKLFQKDLIFKG